MRTRQFASCSSRASPFRHASTRSVVTDEKTLRAELRATRKRGYGLALEEGEVGMAAMACPIFYPAGVRRPEAWATVSVAGPVVRMTRPRILQIAKELNAAALEFSSIWPMRPFVEGAAAPPTNGKNAPSR